MKKVLVFCCGLLITVSSPVRGLPCGRRRRFRISSHNRLRRRPRRRKRRDSKTAGPAATPSLVCTARGEKWRLHAAHFRRRLCPVVENGAVDRPGRKKTHGTRFCWLRESHLPGHHAPKACQSIRARGRTDNAPSGSFATKPRNAAFDPEKIGALGFSAGSHLQSWLATSSLTPAYQPVDELDQLPCHINWAVPVYTAYASHRRPHRPNTREGDAIDVKLSDVFKFDARLSDGALPRRSGHLFAERFRADYRQLRRMKIPAEIHLFADRPHGFMGDPRRVRTAPATTMARPCRRVPPPDEF